MSLKHLWPLNLPRLFVRVSRRLSVSTHPVVSSPDPVSVEISDQELNNLQPAGSALFSESVHFSPTVRPQPQFNWDVLRQTLPARGSIVSTDRLEKLELLDKTIADLRRRIDDLHEKRLGAKKAFKSATLNPSALRVEARKLRLEQQQLKDSLRESLGLFLKPALALPNSLHPKCPLGEELRVERIFQPRHIKSESLCWSDVEDDLHETSLGTYLTGSLARLEQTQLDWARTYWLDPVISGTVAVYPILLSDLARGPAVEGSAWTPMDQAIRLQPTPNDVFTVNETRDKESNQTWLVNPFTSSYLVGSASLESFSAYLMCQRARRTTQLPLRLISLGTVYERNLRAVDSHTEAHGPQTCYTQRKQLSLVELSTSTEACDQGFFQLVDDVCRFWAKLQPSWSLSLVFQSARKLQPCEMLRAIVLLNDETTGMGKSIPVASISLLDDWVARRVNIQAEGSADTPDQGVGSTASHGRFMSMTFYPRETQIDGTNLTKTYAYVIFNPTGVHTLLEMMVWAETRRLGCAQKKCKELVVGGVKNRWVSGFLFLVCRYKERGNVLGRTPYIRRRY